LADTNTTTATTPTRDRRTTIRIPKPSLLADATTRAKSPSIAQRGFGVFPHPLSLVLHFAAPVRTGTHPSRPSENPQSTPPPTLRHTGTSSGSTAPKCRRRPLIGRINRRTAEARAVPIRGAEDPRLLGTQHHHHPPTPHSQAFQWDRIAAAPAQKITRRSGSLGSRFLLFVLHLSADGGGGG